jgi:predicted HicB family RNase H-like nuclease
VKHISTLVPAEIHVKLVCEALEKGISLQELQRQIIDEHFARLNEDAA